MSDIKQRQTGREGRPRREDWRLGASLLTAEPGTTIVADATWKRGGVVRAIFVEVDRGVIVLDIDGVHRRVSDGQIRRWRPAPLLEPGAFVVLVGVPRDEWRGVVVATDGFEVEVESTDGTETIYADELESAWDRPDGPEPPPRKPGRMAADEAVERINSEAFEATQAARQRLMGVGPDGWAE